MNMGIRNPGDYYNLKLEVLRFLREAFQMATLTREKTPIDVDRAADHLQVSVEVVQGTLAELLRLQLAKPLPSTPEHLAAVFGRCEITTKGLETLHEDEVWWHRAQVDGGLGEALPDA